MFKQMIENLGGEKKREWSLPSDNNKQLTQVNVPFQKP